MLDALTSARLTVIEALPAETVTIPLRLNLALPFTWRAVPPALSPRSAVLD
jgi:hypothetical protein